MSPTMIPSLPQHKNVNEKYGHIDVLVNNAGILVEHLGDRPARQVWKDTFDTNVFGVAAVTDAFIPLLKKSIDPAPRIVFVSSDLVRLEKKYDPTHQYFKRLLPIYSSSKAAMDMLALHYAKDCRAGWGAGKVGMAAEWSGKSTSHDPGKIRQISMGTEDRSPLKKGPRMRSAWRHWGNMERMGR
jgi:NAD(P)-dependent dehydrogenase (short-subunit alcohol dehydrogenase family)